MKTLACDEVRDVVPAWARGELDTEPARAVAAHLRTCERCEAEAEVVRALLRNRAAPPPGLADRIARAAAGAPSRPWYRRHGRPLAIAASAAALLLAGRVAVDRTLAPDADPREPGTASEADAAAVDASLAPAYSAWPGADGVLAGSVVLQSLTDEELEALVKELET